jgi:hypothetical protein
MIRYAGALGGQLFYFFHSYPVSQTAQQPIKADAVICVQGNKMFLFWVSPKRVSLAILDRNQGIP